MSRLIRRWSLPTRGSELYFLGDKMIGRRLIAALASGVGTMVLGSALQPLPAAAQMAAPAGEPTPSREISLTDLRVESKAHEIYLERPRKLNVSKTIDDQLTRGENFRRVYALRLLPGQAIQIDLSSDELDTLLRAYDDSGKLVAENDDGGGNTNSRLYLAALDKARMRYFVVATTTRLREGGIELAMREREAPRSGGQSPIALDSTVAGKLDPTSPLNIADQVVYDSYVFSGTEGDRIKVVATPEDAPVGLQLKVGDLEPFKSGTNVPGRPVTIFGPLKASGQVELLVTGSPAATSGYKLELTRLLEAATSGPVPVRIGQEVAGTFGPGTPLIPQQNRPYALYILQGRAGETVNVSAQLLGAGASRMSKSDYGDNGGISVEVGVDSPMGFATVLQSRFRVPLARNARFDRDGTMLIRVSGPTGTTGAYKLKVMPAIPLDVASSLKAE